MATPELHPGPARNFHHLHGYYPFRRFSDWRKADVFAKLFAACSDEPDLEYAMVDATIVKVHRPGGQGAKGGLSVRP